MPSLKPLAALAAAVALLGLLQGYTLMPHRAGGEAAAQPPLVRIESGGIAYRLPGAFLDAGAPVNGPLVEIAVERPFSIMERQVTRAEYLRCVAAGACAALRTPGAADRPVVGVNWDDAVAYAGWLSRATGATWRLPSDREWALAAGSRYRDDAVTEIGDPANPARRWLAAYEAGAGRDEPLAPDPQPLGAFGRNEQGLLDVAGNVWEWTSGCFERHSRAAAAEAGWQSRENCGVRIAQGRHRSYLTSFVRDPKAGACALGLPPANLGLRLVREDPDLLQRAGRLLRP